MTSEPKAASTIEPALARLGRLRGEIALLEAELGLSRESTATPPTDIADIATLGLINEFGSDFISVHAASGAYLHASRAGERLFGWSPADLVGQNAYAFFHPEDIEQIAKDHAAHLERREKPSRDQCVRYRLRCKSGEYRWVETRSRARSSEQGVEQIVCITRDVHEERMAMLSSRAASLVLAEQARAAVAGGVVSALSHELNNPLAIAMLALDEATTGPVDTQRIREAREAIERMNQVIRELALVVRGDWVRQGEVDLISAVERVVALLPAGRPCKVESDYEPACVRGPEALVLQCLYHIAFSHVQGTSKQAREIALSIRLRTLHDHAEFILSSAATEVPLAVRADLTALAFDGGGRPHMASPMGLAERTARQLGGSLENTVTERGLTTRLLLALQPTAHATSTELTVKVE